MNGGDRTAKATGQLHDAAEGHAPEQRAVYLLIDADVMDWLQGESADWPRHVNVLLRFYKDTSQQREELFADVLSQPDMDAPLDTPSLK